MTQIIKKDCIINNDKIKNLSSIFGLDEIVIEFLVNQGYQNEEDIDYFLNANQNDLTSPFKYTNMDRAVTLLKNAVAENKHIIVYGDYDCDGIGATAIIYNSCKDNGIYVDYYIPIRADEGYGLSKEAICKIKKEFNPDIMLTVDCGITALDEVRYARSLGIEVIVSDHHKPGEILPDCIIINPCLDPELTPLCGAGVALKIVEGWFGKDTAYKYLDICAISTIADIVPLIKDNRIIAKCGMNMIRNGDCRKGIKALIKTANADYKKLSTYDMAFKIAPRLNASGRLNTAYTSLSLLIEDDNTMINLLADELEMQNAERQELNETIYVQALKMLKKYDFGENRIIILYNKSWNEGVLGIVAARLTEEFNLPSVLLTEKEGYIKGSARSISGVNIYDVLNSCRDLFISFGGHAMAAGVSLLKENYIPFLNKANSYLQTYYKSANFYKKITYDFDLPIAKMTLKLAKQFALLEPYGCANPKPVFFDACYNASFKRIGKTKHIKSSFRNGELVLFGCYDNMSYYNRNCFSVAYTTGISIYKERESVQVFSKSILFDVINSINDDVFINNYLKTLLYDNYNNNSGYISEVKSSEKPVLYITFEKNNFLKFIESHCDIEKFIFFNDYKCTQNSIVLCPEKNFDFNYYGQIVLLEIMSQNYIEFLKSKVGIVQTAGKFYPYYNKSFTNIEMLREDYKFFRNILQIDYSYKSVEEFFQFCTENGYKNDFDVFLSSLCVFSDVELIKKNENDILHIKRNKVNIENSEIYNLLADKDKKFR